MKKHAPSSAVAAALVCQLAAFASATPGEIQAAVDKANVLPAGTSMNVRVNNNQAVIATYQNAKANDRDCKIDAVMIAKTAMDLDSSIARVTVYFYNRADMTHYKEVGLSTGDIKAFGSGQVDKESFLNSVSLVDRQVEDVAKISNYIEAAALRRDRPVDVNFKSGKVEVSTQIENWVSDRDVRFEALRLAEKALDAAPAGMVKSIHITFADPANEVPAREVTISPDTVKTLNAQLVAALSPIAVNQAAKAGSVSGLVAGEGALKERRQKALDRIKALQKDGVNVKNFMDLWLPIEALAPQNDPAKITDQLGRLESALDDMESTRKALKEKEKPKAVAAADNGPAAPAVGPPMEDRRCFGYELVDWQRIIQEPDAYADHIKKVVPGPRPAEENANYFHAMRYFAQILRMHNMIPQAEKYDRIVYQMQLKHPNLLGGAGGRSKPPGAQ